MADEYGYRRVIQLNDEPDLSIRERIATLMDEHLDPAIALSLADAADVIAAGIAVGDDPVVVTDCEIGGVLGLWVLTTEGCLWERAALGAGLVDIGLDSSWSDISNVVAHARPDGLADVDITWPSSTVRFGAVGATSWAEELVWTVRQLVELDGRATRRCSSCRLWVGDQHRDGECVLCESQLLPSDASDTSHVVARRLAGRGRVHLPRAETAASAAIGDEYPWITTSAVFEEQLIVVAATDGWVRAWNEDGELVLDSPLERIDATAEPHEGAWKVAIEEPGGRPKFLTGFASAGAAADVADRIARPAEPALSGLTAGPAVRQGSDLPGPFAEAMPATMVRCPMCAETIQAAALVCRYCGARFDGAPPVPATGTNGMAVASLVLGVLWLYWLGSVLALIVGYIARGQIDRTGGTQGGRGLATAGIVLGWIGVAVLGLVAISLLIASSAMA